MQADPHMREVTRGTLLAFALKIAGSGFTFLFNVLVARILGADGAGLYFLALAITTIGSVIGRVGLDNAMLRFIATRAACRDWGGVKSVYSLGMKTAVVAAGLITLLVFLLAPWLAINVFNKEGLAEPLRWMSLSILPIALLNLQAESLKGLKRIRDAMIIQGIGVPLIGIMLIVPLAHSSGVIGVSLAYLGGAVMTVIIGIWAWKGAIDKQEEAGSTFLIKELIETCKPLFTVSIMNRAILPWASLFFLGIWASSEDVGIFGAASRIAMLVSFMLATVNNVLAPKFAELYANHDMENLGHLARRTALLISLLSSPIFIVLIFGGQFVMSIFGDVFKGGALPLSILAVGQLVNAYTGSVGYLLMMSGNERILMKINMASVLLMCVSILLLVPHFGIVGAALATSISWITMNIAATFQVKKRLGICPVLLPKLVELKI